MHGTTDLNSCALSIKCTVYPIRYVHEFVPLCCGCVVSSQCILGYHCIYIFNVASLVLVQSYGLNKIILLKIRVHQLLPNKDNT